MKEIALISAANAASTITSVQLDLGDMKEYSIQNVFSSNTLGGTLQLQASNDNSNWSDIGDSGASKTVSSGVSHTFNVTGAAYRYARVKWTNSAGTGTLTSQALIKENPIKGA